MAGYLDTANRGASVSEIDRAVASCKEIFVFGEE